MMTYQNSTRTRFFQGLCAAIFLLAGVVPVMAGADLWARAIPALVGGAGLLDRGYTQTDYEFHIELQNLGTERATSVTLSFNMPAGLIVEPVHTVYAPSSPFGMVGGDPAHYFINYLDPGETLRLAVPMRYGAAGQYTFSASAGLQGYEANTKNNLDIRNVNVEVKRIFDVEASIAASNYAPTAGDLVTFTLTCHNHGPDEARYLMADFMRYDDFQDWEVVSTSVQVKNQPRMGAFTQFGRFKLDPDQQAEVTMVLRALRPTPERKFELTVRCQDYFDAFTDTNPANNTASVNIAINGTLPDYTLQAEAFNVINTAQADGFLTTNYVITNVGPDAAREIQIKPHFYNRHLMPFVILPAPEMTVDWSTGPGTFPTAIHLPYLAAGESTVFTVIYKIEAAVGAGTAFFRWDLSSIFSRPHSKGLVEFGMPFAGTDVAGAGADLAVAIKAPAEAILHQPYTCQIRVTNKAKGKNAGLVSALALPGAEIIAATAGKTPAPFTGNYAQGYVSLKGRSTQEIILTIIPRTTGWIHHYATVSSDAVDSNLANNTAHGQVYVKAPGE